MSDIAVQELADGLRKTCVQDDGVSFKGRSLVLNTEEDCGEVVDAIKSCRHLEYLSLEGNTLGVEGSKAISKALESRSELKRALWRDMFTGRSKEEIPKALEILGNGLTLAGAQLTELDLSDNAFGPIGVKGLAGLISSRACYQLQVLKLNNNGLGISGGKMLADALLQCYKNSANEGRSLPLRIFVAGRNRLENKGAAELAKVFETLGTLEEIRMPQNGIDHKGIEALSESLRKNHNLKVLNLNDNTVTKKGAKHIAKALPHLQQLRVLNLGDCLLRTGGAIILASALAKKHEHLEELHLNSNEIRCEGSLVIVEAMTNKSKLKQLNLNGNIFGKDGRKLLKEGLEKNKRIESLGGLSEDDSSDEDDKSDDSDDQNGEPESDEEDEEEENDFSPHKENSDSKKSSPRTEPSDALHDIFSNLGIKQDSSRSIENFLKHPVLENFLPVKEDHIEEFLKNKKDSSVEFYIDTFIPMLMKISSLSCCINEDVVKLTTEVSNNMYRDLFTWASDKNQLSIVNNALFVHLGFIKSEDKSFEINWNVKGSLGALKSAASEGRVPASTQEILDCLLKKEECKPCTGDDAPKK